MASVAGPSRLSNPSPNGGMYGSMSPPSPLTQRSPNWTLPLAADALLASSRQAIRVDCLDVPLPTPAEELSIHLYALHLLERQALATCLGSSIDSRRGIRAQVSHREEEKRLADHLLRRSQALLAGDVMSESAEEGQGRRGHDGEDEGDVQLMEMLWRPWSIDETTTACAIDLLLPPYSSPRSAQLLANPLISATLDSAWHFGVPPASSTDTVSARRSSLRSTYVWLRSQITPRRIHFYHLVSFFVLYGFCLSLALKPGRLITPYPNAEHTGDVFMTTTDGGGRIKPGPREILALTWIGSDLGMTITHRPNLTRFMTLLPLYLVLLFTFLDPQTSFTLLTLSIPFSTTLLVLPQYPSVALLTSSASSCDSPTSLLRLSSNLSSTLYRLTRPFILLAPLILSVFALFSWAMNGDLSRGFIILGQHVLGGPAWLSAIPIEEGIAPYQARLALFISTILLLIYAIIMGATAINGGADTSALSEMAIASRRKFAQAVRSGLGKPASAALTRSATQSGSQRHNAIDEESSLLLLRHTKHASGDVRGYRSMGPAICPSPLDQLFFPLDAAHGVVRLAGKLGWESSRYWLGTIEGLAEKFAVVLVGPLCSMLIPVEWLFGRLDSRTGSEQKYWG